jgi:hypothetical protein
MDGYLSEMDDWKQKEQFEANTLRIAVAIGCHRRALFCAAHAGQTDSSGGVI